MVIRTIAITGYVVLLLPRISAAAGDGSVGLPCLDLQKVDNGCDNLVPLLTSVC